jgi:hypothetical protein
MMKIQPRNTMNILYLIFAATLLTTFPSAAVAQTEFQLPRECSERVVVNPERCVIQDGPPRLPLVPQARRPEGGSGTSQQTPQTPQPNTAAPMPRTPPASPAPFSARR